MSVTRTCDCCGMSIVGNHFKVEADDLFVMVGAESYVRLEDVCGSCRGRIGAFINELCGDVQKSAIANADVSTFAPIDVDMPGGNKAVTIDVARADDISAKVTKNDVSIYVPHSGVDPDSLAEGVTKRWDLPKVRHSGQSRQDM